MSGSLNERIRIRGEDNSSLVIVADVVVCCSPGWAWRLFRFKSAGRLFLKQSILLDNTVIRFLWWFCPPLRSSLSFSLLDNPFGDIRKLAALFCGRLGFARRPTKPSFAAARLHCAHAFRTRDLFALLTLARAHRLLRTERTTATSGCEQQLVFDGWAPASEVVQRIGLKSHQHVLNLETWTARTLVVQIDDFSSFSSFLPSFISNLLFAINSEQTKKVDLTWFVCRTQNTGRGRWHASPTFAVWPHVASSFSRSWEWKKHQQKQWLKVNFISTWTLPAS